MTRVTVKAAKDPRTTPPLGVSAQTWPDSVPALSPREAATLVAAVRTLCPHDWLDDSPYRDTTLAIANDLAADPQALAIMREGLTAIETRGFASLTEAQRVAALTERTGTPFFRLCLAGALRYFYDLPEVWAGCGYDGAFGCSDAAPRADFDTAGPRP
jgi:hypothetical protein